ncbi:hypothetical protein ACWDOR_31520 [Streptosporangium canum]|uniref:hypothetical protein n=1 Tax=Streptosporangium canum TaxID=324952 RepID=UPI0036AD60ED
MAELSRRRILVSGTLVAAAELAPPAPAADARPELVFNQLTGGSNTTIATYTPIRVAAAIARLRLLAAAAAELGSAVTDLTMKAGMIIDRSGGGIDIGAIAEKAASTKTRQVAVELTPRGNFTVIGKPHNRIDALDAVTGRKKFTKNVQRGCSALQGGEETRNGEALNDILNACW